MVKCKIINSLNNLFEVQRINFKVIAFYDSLMPVCFWNKDEYEGGAEDAESSGFPGDKSFGLIISDFVKRIGISNFSESDVSEPLKITFA